MEKERQIVGWLEKVEFPEIDSEKEPILAKIDTGAYSGALHVDFERIVFGDGKEILEYRPINKKRKIIRTDKFRRIKVKSSNGIEEERHRITTSIIVRGKKYSVELTLADRTDMRYDVIIGRKLLKRARMLVDPSQGAEDRLSKESEGYNQ